MSGKAIEVPMQPYAGKLLIIDQLVVPDSSDDLKVKTNPDTISVAGPKFSDMPRPTFFESKVIEKTLIKYCSLEGITKGFKDELVDGILAAVETYMKYLIQSVIQLCEHRSGNALYNDSRCVVQHNMRTTMMFLNDREVADYGCSDDDTTYGHRRRWMKLQRNRSSNSGELEMRLESTNNTALLALGVRKPFGALAGFGAGIGAGARVGAGTEAGTVTGTATGGGGGAGIGAASGTAAGTGSGTGTAVATGTGTAAVTGTAAAAGAAQVEVGLGASGATAAVAAPRLQPSGIPQPPHRTFIIRIKHMNVKDIIQFMEDQKRYRRTKLLYDAYLTYKW